MAIKISDNWNQHCCNFNLKFMNNNYVVYLIKFFDIGQQNQYGIQTLKSSFLQGAKSIFIFQFLIKTFPTVTIATEFIIVIFVKLQNKTMTQI